MRPLHRQPTAAAAAITFALALLGCHVDRNPPKFEAGTPIVLVSIDTLRSDHLGIYRYAFGATPAIDALRRDATLFERAYANVPLTLPSHVSILTGLLPPRHGVRDNAGYRFDGERLPYLPRLLKQAGYATGAAVSAYVLRGATGLAAGFDFYDDHISSRIALGPGGVQRPGIETLEGAKPWLRSVVGRPFFFFLHIYEPHTPYDPPEPFATRFAAAPYDGEIAAADQVVGELVGELRRLGVYDRAVVLLLSDHGEGLHDHGEAEHGILLYRENLQVPLLLKLPGGALAGRSVEAPVQLVDVVPTLAAVAGIALPASVDGESLLAIRESARPHRAIYSETYFPRLHFGWSELFSLIYDQNHLIDGPDPELYDLERDPDERRSTRDRERRTLADLRQRLAAFARPFDAPTAESDETERALAALGYVGSLSKVPSGALPDPKGQLPILAELEAGVHDLEEQRVSDALVIFQRAVEANPNLIDGWELLGQALHKLGNNERALAAYERAFELSGGRRELAVSIGRLLLQLQHTERALEFVHLERRRSPEEIRLGHMEIQALLLLHRLPEALVEAEELARQFPDSADAHYQLGVVEMGLRRLVEAEREFRRALELAPAHLPALSDFAVLLESEGRPAEAAALLDRVRALRPEENQAADGLEQPAQDD